MISIIIPFYKGNKYINNLLRLLDEAAELVYLNTSTKCQVIIVVDSPEVVPLIDYTPSFLSLTEVKNDRNYGLHKSRVIGLKQAKYEFIKFIDQDDWISKDSLHILYTTLSNSHYDMVFSNGILQYSNVKYQIYNSKNTPFISIKTLLGFKNIIISPGQTLIRKNSIPETWYKNIVINNGADDYYLWILMLNEQKSFVYVPDILYSHVDTGINLSYDKNKMYNSLFEVLDFLKDDLNDEKYTMIQSNITYRRAFTFNKFKFITMSLLNPIRMFKLIKHEKEYSKVILK